MTEITLKKSDDVLVANVSSQNAYIIDISPR